MIPPYGSSKYISNDKTEYNYIAIHDVWCFAGHHILKMSDCFK